MSSTDRQRGPDSCLELIPKRRRQRGARDEVPADSPEWQVNHGTRGLLNRRAGGLAVEAPREPEQRGLKLVVDGTQDSSKPDDPTIVTASPCQPGRSLPQYTEYDLNPSFTETISTPGRRRASPGSTRPRAATRANPSGC